MNVESLVTQEFLTLIKEDPIKACQQIIDILNEPTKVELSIDGDEVSYRFVWGSTLTPTPIVSPPNRE